MLRTPKALLSGLLWFDPDDPNTLNQMRARHEASQGDGFATYGWKRHDGRLYGIQELVDGEYNITLSMVSLKASPKPSYVLSVTPITPYSDQHPRPLCLLRLNRSVAPGMIYPTYHRSLSPFLPQFLPKPHAFFYHSFPHQLRVCVFLPFHLHRAAQVLQPRVRSWR